MGHERWELRNDLGGREHERPSEERDRHDRHDQRARRAHRAAKNLCTEVRQPGAVRTAPAPILQDREQDALVQLRGGARRGQRPQQTEDPGAPADLGSARGAALDVGGQACRVRRFQLVEQERVDQVTGARAIQGVANLRVRHNPYMT
jgi:hypothetical protein